MGPEQFFQMLQCPWISRADPHRDNESACRLGIFSLTLERNGEILVRIMPLAIDCDRLPAVEFRLFKSAEKIQAIRKIVVQKVPDIVLDWIQ